MNDKLATLEAEIKEIQASVKSAKELVSENAKLVRLGEKRIQEINAEMLKLLRTATPKK